MSRTEAWANLYPPSRGRTIPPSRVRRWRPRRTSRSNRPEAAATDKLIDIIKTGTDSRLRQQAISALTRKKDPRATQLLIELIDRKMP